MMFLLLMKTLALWSLLALGLAQTEDRTQCINIDPCGETPAVIEEEGTICFPFSGGQYERDQDCRWTIQAPFFHTISLEIQTLDLELCTQCPCDFLSIVDGEEDDDSATQLANLCGSVTNTTFLSTNNLMSIHFSSDHVFNGDGFVAMIQFTFQPPHTGVAFYAVSSQPQSALNSPKQLEFDGVKVNDGAVFDLGTNSFHCPYAGHYYFSLSAGTSPNTPVQLMVRLNGEPYASLIKTTTEYAERFMIERGLLLYLEVGDEVDVEIGAGTGVYSENVSFQTSLTGFRLPYDDEERAAQLFAARIANMTGAGDVDLMEKRLVTVGDWGEDSGRFTIPQSGVYFNTFSMESPRAANNQVRYNGATILRTNSNYGPHSITHTNSGGVLTDSTQGDEVSLYASSGGYGGRDYQISLTSFLVSLEPFQPSLVGAVRTSSLSVTGRISFDLVVAEQNANFNNETGTFVCITPGTYFVHATVMTRSGHTSVVDIKQNSQTLSSLTDYVVGYLSTSKSLVVQLEAGDELYLELVQGQLYSSSNRFISFSVVLLYGDF